MARNGIWVHLAVIKRRRCKELSAATPFSARIGVFHPEEIHVRGILFYKAAPPRYRRRWRASVYHYLLPSQLPRNILYVNKYLGNFPIFCVTIYLKLCAYINWINLTKKILLLTYVTTEFLNFIYYNYYLLLVYVFIISICICKSIWTNVISLIIWALAQIIKH